MISAWHLLWIVPLAASFGFLCTAVLSVNRLSCNAPNTTAYKPEHCWECAHTYNCNTAYGWSGCKYQDAITRETIRRTLGEDEKKEESV